MSLHIYICVCVSICRIKPGILLLEGATPNRRWLGLEMTGEGNNEQTVVWLPFT